MAISPTIWLTWKFGWRKIIENQTKSLYPFIRKEVGMDKLKITRRSPQRINSEKIVKYKKKNMVYTTWRCLLLKLDIFLPSSFFFFSFFFFSFLFLLSFFLLFSFYFLFFSFRLFFSFLISFFLIHCISLKFHKFKHYCQYQTRDHFSKKNDGWMSERL